MYIRANINGWHTVLHLNEGEREATVIAFPQDAEKADFMVKALNHFGYNGIETNNVASDEEIKDYLGIKD